MLTITFATICLLTVVYGKGDCDCVKCPIVPKHYKELGCKPIIEKDGCCPSRFDCPDLSSYATDKCYFNGHAFKIDQEIPTNQITGMCIAGCFCAEGYPKGRPAEFQCAHIDCPHFLNPALSKCLKQTTLDSCCPKYLCTDEEIKSVGTEKCELEGKTYSEGEAMFPDSNKCYKCICDDKFKNKTITGNPMCKEVNCGIGLRNFNLIRDGCIPKYYSEDSCCPIEWRCPQATDVAIPAEIRSETSDSKLKCQYGKLTLNVNDEIQTNNECEICKCVTPPMASCVKKPNCVKQ